MIAMLAAVLLFARSVRRRQRQRGPASTDDESDSSAESSGRGGGRRRSGEDRLQHARRRPRLDGRHHDNAEGRGREVGRRRVHAPRGRRTTPPIRRTRSRQLIADNPDVLVDPARRRVTPLTPVAQKAMEPGHPGRQHRPRVLDPRRLPDAGSAATTTASAWQAGNYFADQLECKGKVVEIQGIAGISVTEERSAGLRRRDRGSLRRRHRDRRPAAGRLHCRTRA